MIKWTVYDPHGFYLKSQMKKKGCVVTKEFKHRSEQIAIFPTQRQADEFAHKYLEDSLQSKESNEKLDAINNE